MQHRVQKQVHQQQLQDPDVKIYWLTEALKTQNFPSPPPSFWREWTSSGQEQQTVWQ